MQRFAQRHPSNSSNQSKENKNGTSSTNTAVKPNVAAAAETTMTDFGNVDMMAGDGVTGDLMMDTSSSFMDYDSSGADAWMAEDSFGTTDATNFDDFGIGGVAEDPSTLQASEANFDNGFDIPVDKEGQAKEPSNGIGVLSKTGQSQFRGDEAKTLEGGGPLFQKQKQSSNNQKSTIVQQKVPSSLNKGGNRRNLLSSKTQNDFARRNNVVPQSQQPPILPKKSFGSEAMTPPRTHHDLSSSIDQASTTMGVYSDIHNVDHNLRILPPPSPKPAKKPSRVSLSPKVQPPPPATKAQEQRSHLFGHGTQAEEKGKALPKPHHSIVRQKENSSQPQLRRPVPPQPEPTLHQGTSENVPRVTVETAKTPSAAGTKTTSIIQNIPAVTPGLLPSPKTADETAFSSIESTTKTVSPFSDENSNKLSSRSSHKSGIGNMLLNNSSTNGPKTGDFSSVVDENCRYGQTGQQDTTLLLDEGATFDDTNVKFLSDIRDLEDRQKEIEVAMLRRNNEFATAYFHALKDEANIIDLLDQVEQETKHADERLARYEYDG